MVELLLEHGADVNQVEDVRARHNWRERKDVMELEELQDVVLRHYLLEPSSEEPWRVDTACLATPLSVAKAAGADAGLVALLEARGATDGLRNARVPYLPTVTEEERETFVARALS